MQDIIIFALVGISLISGVVLLFDVKSLKLPRLPLPHGLPKPSSLLKALPFFGRGNGADNEEYEDEYDPYQVYQAVDYGDEDAGSFAPGRSPFGATVPAPRPIRRRNEEEDEDDEDLGFDYKPAMFEDEDAAYDAPLAEAQDAEDAELSDDEDYEDEEDDEDEEEKDDLDDMMSFFDKAPEVTKVPEALREGIEKVSAAELLAEAREVSALLRRTNRG